MTLARLLSWRGSLSELETIRFTLALLDIVRSLHGQNPPLVHRDIRPDNILIKNVNSYELALVTVPEFAGQPRRRDQSLGIPEFSAPENITGLMDTRSDLYSVGMITLFMLTDQYLARASQMIRDRRDLPGVSRSMRNFIYKAIQETPTNRYQSAHEMQLALSEIYIRKRIVSDDEPGILPLERPLHAAVFSYLARTASFVITIAVALASLGLLLMGLASSEWASYITWLFILNVLTFIVFLYDKMQARSRGMRVSEIALLVLILSGGFVGALAGMLVLRHKAVRLVFRVTVAFSTCLYSLIAFWLLAS